MSNDAYLEMVLRTIAVLNDCSPDEYIEVMKIKASTYLQYAPESCKDMNFIEQTNVVLKSQGRL